MKATLRNTGRSRPVILGGLIEQLSLSELMFTYVNSVWILSNGNYRYGIAKY
jgi:hypothetical protein